MQRRDYIGLYGTTYDIISKLKKNERPIMWEAVGVYSLALEQPVFPAGKEHLEAVFAAIKIGIDKQHQKAEIGARGGRARLQKAVGIELESEENEALEDDASSEIAERKTQAKAKQSASKTQAKAKQSASKTQAKAKQSVSKTVQEIELQDLFVYYNKNILLMQGAWDKFLVLFGERVRADVLQGDWLIGYQNLARYLYEQMTVDSVLTYTGIEYGPLDWWDISRNLDYSAVLPVLAAMVRNDDQVKEPKYYALGILAERVRAGWIYAPQSIVKQITALGDKVLIKNRESNQLKAEVERERHNFELKRWQARPMQNVLAPPTRQQEEKAKSIWKNLLEEIQPISSNVAYELWIKNLVPIRIDDDVLLLEAGSEIMKKQATQHLDQLQLEQRLKIVC